MGDRERGRRIIAVAALAGAAVALVAGNAVVGRVAWAAPAAVSESDVAALLKPSPNIDRLRSLGPGVVPMLAAVYERSGVEERTQIAWTFYMLGWKSEEAKRVLMRDVHTPETNLRLQVQWALGRVSNDEDVVTTLVDNMRNDRNPLFRDKAACALANDQIHLTEDQKVRLYGRLIEALDDDNLQVRQIALQALRIQTGQTKNFDPSGTREARASALREWQRWLAAYRANM